MEALENLAASRARPAGNLRLSVPRIALELVLWDVIPAFREAFPEITLDLDVNDASIDLPSGQFDAGKYFPVKSHAQPKLRAFIDFARERSRERRGVTRRIGPRSDATGRAISPTA